MKKLTISIVNYNGGEYLLSCLKSLRNVSKELEFDVFVADNASSDGSAKKAKEEYPEFNFILNEKNLGFGKAHNIVLKKAQTSYILTLNPDCEVFPGTLKYMIDFMEKNPDVGISTCRVEKADGSLDVASHRGFPTPWTSFLYYFLKNDRLYHLTGRDMNKVHEIDSAVGAFMLIRKSVLDKIGYFDEDYFLYGEDIDLCFRAKEEGFRIMFVPDVKIVHEKGISSGIKKHSQGKSGASLETRKESLNHFYQTMKIFYKKNYSNKYPFFINWLVYLGIDLKLWLSRKRTIV